MNNKWYRTKRIDELPILCSVDRMRGWLHVQYSTHLQCTLLESTRAAPICKGAKKNVILNAQIKRVDFAVSRRGPPEARHLLGRGEHDLSGYRLAPQHLLRYLLFMISSQGKILRCETIYKKIQPGKVSRWKRQYDCIKIQPGNVSRWK